MPSSPPMDQPDCVRPVSFAAPRIVEFSGMSEYSTGTVRLPRNGEIWGGRPMRRVASIDRLETLEQKKQLNPPRPKYPAPSTKNGRFSSKNVSKAERLTTAGSTSTCPKSGLIVALRVRFDVTRSLGSPT